ncbi:MAG: hypothetical protein RR101_12295 [Burkholderiaceae bacterium]
MLVLMETLPASPIPATPRDIAAVTRRARQIVRRRALISAGAAVVPIPGLDIAVDIGVMVAMIDEVNAEFGLTPAQLDQLAPGRKLATYRAITLVGSTLVGRLVTRELVVSLLKRIGVRLTAKQAARWVPLAGQAVAASISFAALKYLGDQHVADCAKVADALIDLNPPPRAKR